VETVFLEILELRYLLVDGISGYMSRNIAVESGVKVRDRSSVPQMYHARFDNKESGVVVTAVDKSR
jgi:hypothetical protein